MITILCVCVCVCVCVTIPCAHVVLSRVVLCHGGCVDGQISPRVHPKQRILTFEAREEALETEVEEARTKNLYLRNTLKKLDKQAGQKETLADSGLALIDFEQLKIENQVTNLAFVCMCVYVCECMYVCVCVCVPGDGMFSLAWIVDFFFVCFFVCFFDPCLRRLCGVARRP